MQLAQVTFRSREKLSREFVDVWVSRVVRGWWEGGQVLSDNPRFVVQDRAITTVLHLPERFALSKRRTLPFTLMILKDMARAGLRGPHTRIIGPSSDGVPPCRCARPAAYVLMANAVHETTPVRCARCFGAVPLYRLPPVADTEEHNGQYADILRWQQDFRRFDGMWLASGIGERAAFYQLSRVTSELNQSGRVVCTDLEKRCGRKVYYCHWRGTATGDDLAEDSPCPSCRKAWFQKREVLPGFTHRCDRCRLVGM